MAISRYTHAMWLNEDKIQSYYPQFFDFIMQVRKLLSEARS